MSSATAARERPPAAALPVAPAPIPAAVWRLAILIASGAFLSGLDSSVVAVGLDTMAARLGTGLADAQWIATAYLLALGVALPAYGWAGRRFGAGRVWIAAMAAFTGASLLCALAPSLELLVAARVLQGLAAGLLIPAGQTVLGEAVGPERLGRVMATLGIFVTAGPALGPVVGGVVLDVAAWPWLFLLNLPVGVAALVAARRLVPRGVADPAQRADGPGLLLLVTGIPLVVLAATAAGEGHAPGDAAVLVPLVAGVAALAAFIAYAPWLRRRSAAVPGRARPALDLRLLARPRFAAAALTSALAGAVMVGGALVLPLYFQLGRGQDALQAGASMIALGAGSMIALPLVGRAIDRLGAGRVSAVGGVAVLLSTIPFGLLDLGAPWWLVQLLLVVRGVAIALALVPTMTAAYQAVDRSQLPDATALVNILQRLGGAVGGALLAIVLATGLPDGTEVAVQRTFWWLAVAAGLAALSAGWLLLVERRERGG